MMCNTGLYIPYTPPPSSSVPLFLFASLLAMQQSQTSQLVLFAGVGVMVVSAVALGFVLGFVLGRRELWS